MNFETFNFLQAPFAGSEGNDPADEGQFGLWITFINNSTMIIRSTLQALRFEPFLLHIIQTLDAEEVKRRGADTIETLTRKSRRLSHSNLMNFLQRLQQRVAESDEPEADALARGLLALFVVELNPAFGAGLSNAPQDLHSNIVALEVEIASYTAFRAQSSLGGVVNDRVEKAIADFEIKSGQMLLEGQRSVNDLTKTLMEMQSQGSALRSQIDQQVERSVRAEADAINVLKSLETTDEKLEAFKTAVKIDFGIDTSRKLWNTRAASANWAFGTSTVLLIIFLIAIPAVAAVYWRTVVDIIEQIGNATLASLPANANGAQLTAATVTRLIVLGAPLALYFWVIRLIIRFNLRSLALADDAKQRMTMMDTYFYLLEKQGAVKEDRALILNALFRPGPGQVSDNVDPPNFTELVGKAMGKG